MPPVFRYSNNKAALALPHFRIFPECRSAFVIHKLNCSYYLFILFPVINFCIDFLCLMRYNGTGCALCANNSIYFDIINVIINGSL